MGHRSAFQLHRDTFIQEIQTQAKIYTHVPTGARILSMENDDENKVFGVTFRTPPKDASGLPHILEHSVLCGSRKYPVKEPFVELLKGSLQTFLNAFTYPDKTCYPVASQNLQDFYNLVDVYLDSVFYPKITPWIFKQEGWHYELENRESPLQYKGVVYNEMRGAYSSPDRLVVEYSQQSLFPDTPYGLDSGGDPQVIPTLTYEQFKAFHETYYHPSNAWFYFYGNDDPDRRLAVLEDLLKDFQPRSVDSRIPLQPPFTAPRRVHKTYAVGKDQPPKAMVTVNWLLTQTEPPETHLALHILEYVLLGMPGSPLRRALIESGLGEDLAGVGLEAELQQMMFSTGLKGVAPKNLEKVEALILNVVKELAEKGIPKETVEAALNTLEFRLRENNTGPYPRGLALMLRALTTWLYDGDPLALVAFETPLNWVKEKALSGTGFLEELLVRYWVNNPHRATLFLEPDETLEERQRAEEAKKLAERKASMSPQDLERLVKETRTLRQLQETPDPPEALATIPRLRLEDLERENKKIPAEDCMLAQVPVLTHDLFTNGIVYLDLAFEVSAVPAHLLGYVPLLGRALLEMGTEKEDYVRLNERISRKTGGISVQTSTFVCADGHRVGSWLLIRGKALTHQVPELCAILRDLVTAVRLDNRDRFRQIALESKARREASLIPEGHRFVARRVKAPWHAAHWAEENMKGIESLFFVRKLCERVDSDWEGVLADLEQVRHAILSSKNLRANVTVDEATRQEITPVLEELLAGLPAHDTARASWLPNRMPHKEGFTGPLHVNYVAKGLNLRDAGFRFRGSALVVSHFLRTGYLWDRVRVQGGAYGAFTQLDRFSGDFTLVSYRDPNVHKTLHVYDQCADFLKTFELHQDELTKAIIGVIGDLDRHLLPDAKGFTSFMRHLAGDDDAARQRMRDEVLATTRDDFRAFGELLDSARDTGRIVVLGSRESLASEDMALHISQVL
ncbi:insulinase family protein [Desulfosoma caldarium]|uniref:Pre-sequence protease n=1 Tax=Desulfosoma caldarium TaxID=610254 RepID=A0A3N1UYH9_9BACT|nr:insulinase family protein [Desulfosoma caldarium]ROQ92346.1 pre-sequence protease [Desulfosoma caldarium]